LEDGKDKCVNVKEVQEENVKVEEFVVSSANASTEPWTVVVKFLDANPTERTVRSSGRSEDVA
jgi:hypothetical protein